MSSFSDGTHFSRSTVIAGVAALALLGLGIFVLEKRRPLRRRTQPMAARTVRNLVLGATSMAVINWVEKPLTQPLATRAARDRKGLVQRLPLPAAARDALALLAMDYTIYLWHVATHRVPFLWRFHLVHHIDLDLDESTAVRFHAGEMAISIPYRAAQVALIGVSPRALSAWRGWLFLSVLFHHSNLRLPRRLENALSLVLTTPRMHGIHHSTVRGETDSNWSSGFSFWDRLHGTFRLDTPQDAIAIGVPAYRDPADTQIEPSLAMPFGRERNAWTPAPDGPPVPLTRLPDEHRKSTYDEDRNLTAASAQP